MACCYLYKTSNRSNPARRKTDRWLLLVVWGDENVLQLDRCGGCLTVRAYAKCHWILHLKMVSFMVTWISPYWRSKGKKVEHGLIKETQALESDLGLWLGSATFSSSEPEEIIQSHSGNMHIHEISSLVTCPRQAFSLTVGGKLR